MKVKHSIHLTTLLVTVSQVLFAVVDCGMPFTRQQTIVCATPQLKILDEQLWSVYKRALATTSDSGRKQFEHEEASWEVSSGDCSDRVDCIKKRYTDRIATLLGYIGQINTPSAQKQTDAMGTPLVYQKSIPAAQDDASQRMPPPVDEGITSTASQAPESSAPTPSVPLATPNAPSAPPTPLAAQNEPPSIGTSQANRLPPAPVPPSNSRFVSTVSSALSGVFSTILGIAALLYVIWGAYWGCQIVYPRMMAWYKSSTWLIFGTGPMDILKRQIIFGLQVRFWAVVIGMIVGCLGGAVYMQFLRPAHSVRP